MEFHDRAVLITGGKRIGAVIAADLARRGLDVALTYNRSSREAEDTAAAVREAGRRAVVIHADVSDAAACLRLVNEAAAALGRLDVLINMASVYTERPFDE
ncbi:MAG TPA: SDR family NAD(P)-dependent oxidoreductase, partial [Vicinamibacterales bacterium]|nr:SDR family NAD(P)-dependent oxidoreductase [Vicinamibacterales bacterium]